MKTNNKKKVVVSVLALAMGAGLAGSISGSVAWYQYSTRTTAQLEGVSAGTSRNLQVRIKDGGTYNAENNYGFKSDITKEDIEAYLGIVANGGNQDGKPDELILNPSTIRTSDRTNNGALAIREENTQTVLDFRGQPVYQYGDLPKVGKMTTASLSEDTKFNYIQIPLEFQLLDDGVLSAKDIYLTAANFLDLREDRESQNPTKADITPALRLHISNGTNNFLIADTIAETTISGSLDLNANGQPDRDGFSENDTDPNENIINYGNYDPEHKNTKTSIASEDILAQASFAKANVLAGDADAYSFTNKTNNSLGQTIGVQQTQTYLTLTLTIWLEGWTALDVPGAETPATSNLWDLKYSGSDFGLQLRFACEANA